MFGRVKNIVRLTRSRIFGQKAQSGPKLTATEETQLSWAKCLSSFEAVPDTYRDYFSGVQTQVEGFPYSLLTPSYEGFINRTTEKLISDLGDEIRVLERSRRGIRARHFPLAAISYIEYRKVLLDSHIKVCGLNRQGELEVSTWRFNTVTDHLFVPLLARMRRAPAQLKMEGVNPEGEKFVAWVHLNYKFMMLAMRSLLGGEKVLFFHLQPEVRTPVVRLLGKTFYRVLAATHACILTDRELILIREDGWYGGIRDYIPLQKIEAISLAEKGRDLLELSIRLKEGTHFRDLYPALARQEMEGLILRFGEAARTSQ